MLYMSWTRNLELGIPALDRDHRRLIDLFVRVQQLPGKDADARDLVRATVDDLVDHVTHHFHREQLLMQLVGYPDAPRHRRSHEAIAARLGEFQSLLRRNSVVFPQDRFRDFVTGRLSSHLLDDDMDLKPWVDRLAERSAA